MNLHPVAFIDVSSVVAGLVTKYRQLYTNDRLVLRAPKKGGEIVDQPVLAGWKSARALLLKVKNGAAPYNGGQVGELGEAWLEALKPGVAQPWRADEGEYAESHVRLHVALLTNPFSFLYCGGESRWVPAGEACAINHRLLHSAVNFGQIARHHLVVDVRRPEAG